MQRKAAKLGFDWPDVDGALPKIAEEAGELVDAAAERRRRGDVADELGDLLFAVVNVARHLERRPGVCLRAATHKFRARFEQVERLAARARHRPPRRPGSTTLDALWDEVKRMGTGENRLSATRPTTYS